MNDNLFNKPCIFVTSLGRTGTHFLGYKLQNFIADCTSLHEPDVIFLGKPLLALQKMKEIGILQMTLGKFTTKYSLLNLKIARQRGTVNATQVISHIRTLRKNILTKITTPIYAEANAQLSGFIDILPQIFPNSRILFIIRDPRYWVRSCMNRRDRIYSWRDIRMWIPHGRIKPHLVADPYQQHWPKMSDFEKICWMWGHDTRYTLQHITNNDFARVFRFEDLFEVTNKEQHFCEMLEFLTTFPKSPKATWQYQPQLLSEKIDSSATGKKTWKEWTPQEAKQLERHCGEWMKQFGYGQEEEWLEKLTK